jgi:membrane-bound metal-dependent hydrolase YbcI (DUF457 family)
MSGYATHLLIGAVGGLALTRLLPDAALPSASAAVPLLEHTPEGVVVLTSAFAASWPDIDEPGSFVSRRVRWTITILTGLLLALVGLMAFPSVPMPGNLPSAIKPALGAAAGIALGMGLIGPLLGMEVLRLIRTMAGGHRRLTHALVLSLPLALLAMLLWSVQPVAAVAVGLLAWGQWLHLLGDLVTPSGVPLLYPLTTRDTHLLPRPLTTIGEPLIASAALLCGGWLLTP